MDDPKITGLRHMHVQSVLNVLHYLNIARYLCNGMCKEQNFQGFNYWLKKNARRENSGVKLAYICKTEWGLIKM